MENLKFPAFPYVSYPIQIDFMNALYRFLENGGVSMLESPTGASKTLSIICSALQWVVDRKKRGQLGIMNDSNRIIGNDSQIGSDDEPDWMKNFVVNEDVQKPVMKTEEMFKFGLKKHEKQHNRESYRDLFLLDLEEEEFQTKKASENLQNRNYAAALTDEFLLEEYESEEEGTLSGGKSKRKAGGLSVSSSSDEEEENGSDEDKGGLKVLFCSRTHSQLSQFIKGLRKATFTNIIKVV